VISGKANFVLAERRLHEMLWCTGSTRMPLKGVSRISRAPISDNCHVPNFTFGGVYLGVSGPKKPEKLPKLQTFFPHVPTPCRMLVKFVGFMQIIDLQKLLTFGAIWLVN